MTKRMIWLLAHVVLLMIASTSFTIIPCLSDQPLHWEYYRYRWQEGWGQPYVSPYSLPVLLTYLAAYFTGLIAFGKIWQAGSWIIGASGRLLCLVGAISFACELPLQVTSHYNSRILSAPIVLLFLAVLAVIQEYRRESTGHPMETGLGTSTPVGSDNHLPA